MKLLLKLCFVPLLGLLFSAFSTPIFADAKSDYEYQYSQYRQHYIEYTILKNDFLSNPTLDNQQKAILAAKDTLSTRDLAKASYAKYLLNICQEKQTNYSRLKPVLDNLRTAILFFQNEAQKSLSLVTPADLAQYSNEYAVNTIIHDHSFYTGVVACKISELVRFQTQSKDAFDIILTKLSRPFSTPLQTRIDDLQALGNKINDAINIQTDKLFSEEDLKNIEGTDYFSEKSETMKKIKTLQLKWIDGLIDIDINYAHS